MIRSLLAVAVSIAAPVAAQTFQSRVPEPRVPEPRVPEPRVEVTAAMTASAAGWNAGDLDRFVAIYADDAVFVTPRGLLRGRAGIADHYRASFAGGGNKRGKLGFEMLAYRTISNVHQLLFARWTLTPADPAAKPETGMTTLLFERRKDGWKIIADHSS